MARSGSPLEVDPRLNQISGEVKAGNNDTVISILKEFGVNAVDSDKRTALLWAAFSNNIGLVDWLLLNGADVNHQDSIGYTALHLAAQESRFEVIRLLLQYKADPNLKDIYGNIPLWTAVFNTGGQYEIMKVLLAAGANPDSSNNLERSPRQMAELVFKANFSEILKDTAKQPRSYLLIRSKRTFFTTLLVATLTVLGVWFIGLRQDWSLFKDSLIAISILAVSLLSFLTAGLFFGVKLRDTLGSVTEHIPKFPVPKKLRNFDFGNWGGDWGPGSHHAVSNSGSAGHHAGGAGHGDADGDGCGDGCGEIVVWIIVAVVAVFVLWVAAAVVWVTFLTCTAILYWLFFRALRFVFRHSAECKGRFGHSLRYGLTYTTLYVGWLYAIILAAHYLH